MQLILNSDGRDSGHEHHDAFALIVVKVFGPNYLREPTPTVTAMLMSIEESRGLIGILGSMDCMHRK